MTDALYDPFTTVLRIVGPGVSPYSARGLTQSLEFIGAAQAAFRSINGIFVDTSAPQFRKYHSIITCTDHNAPAFDKVNPGQQLIIDCAAHLSYKTAGGTPSRTVVPGSSRVEGDYTLYRPRMTFRVIHHSTSEAEWAADVQWTLELEEE